MDPYLERHWGDIHHALITYARDQLQGVLPGDLRARLQERVFVESPTGEARGVYPDIRVIERGWGKKVRPAPAAGLAVAEPLRIRLPDEPVTQGYIAILDLGTGRRVVTVIEILSLANKMSGEGQKLYRRKRDECREAGVNRVEIDLLWAGPWSLALPEPLVPDSHRTAYRVCVSYRAGAEWFGDFYRVPLRERLPVIKVPLRPSDADVPLDLQVLIEQCYRNGGYDQDLDYQAELEPPLDPDDAAWADTLLRKQGRRAGGARKSSKRGGSRRKPK
jgi:hypothetical protein